MNAVIAAQIAANNAMASATNAQLALALCEHNHNCRPIPPITGDILIGCIVVLSLLLIGLCIWAWKTA